ncbi:MAG: phenylacetate--CoA ligase family protein, partial [Planctomycetaceae bacterium]|nr:phenylacetate--CoA ligase family protein [Planctomycetaceae bacterium]
MIRHLAAWIGYPLAEWYQGRTIRAKAAELRREWKIPFAERLLLRQRQLAAALARAGANVPYYRDLFRQHRFDPARVADDPRWLADLPYLTKDIVREQGSRLLSTAHPIAELQPRQTGGSTGPSTIIFYSPDALDWTAAVNLVALEWAGKRPQCREVHLASRFPEEFAWRDRVKEHLKGAVLNRVNIFTDSFDPRSLEQVWRRLSRLRPHLIQGHPSTLYALAVHLGECQLDARGAFQVFESTGEVLDAKKRRKISETFGCDVVDRFGNAEFGIVAYERLGTPDHSLALFDGIVWPETRSHESGQHELVFTALRNDAMPLVRYRTGDLGELWTTASGFSIRNIAGRVHDLVRIAGRHYPTHYLQDLLDRIGGIDEFQVEQRPDGTLVLWLVVGDSG